jgi:hypothetical protein
MLTVALKRKQGILGFTQFTGFGAFVVMMIITNIALLMKMNFKVVYSASTYFLERCKQLQEYTNLPMLTFMTGGIQVSVPHVAYVPN